MTGKEAYPGPWSWYWREEDGEANCGIFWEKHKGMAVSVCRAPRYESKEQWAANASLLSAAPELLEALRDMLAEASGGTKSCGHDFTCVCAGDKARAAIKKATGGSQ